MKEEWKQVPGYPDYDVSNTGKIYSKRKQKIMSPKTDRYGYKCLALIDRDKIKKYFTAHRLVANTFIPNPKNKPQVNHINFDRADNRVENLEWSTAKENIHHTHNHNRNADIKGEKNPMAKQHPYEVWLIKYAYECVSSYKLSKILGINDETIRCIRNGSSWSDIKYEDASSLLERYRSDFLTFAPTD